MADGLSTADAPGARISRRRGWLYRLIALNIGLLLACGVLEIAMRIMMAQQVSAFQERVAADPTNIYNLFEPDPELGWRHRPGAEVTVSSLEDQEPFTIRINEQGLYDLDYPYERPAGGARLLVIGDSYTEAVQVPLHERSFQALEDRFRAAGETPYEIIEMGVARYSPAQYYRVYLSEGRPYDPDVVIVMLYLGNDLQEMHPDSGHSIVLGLAERTFQYTLEDGMLVALSEDDWRPPSGSSRVRAPMPVTRRLHAWLMKRSTLYSLVASRAPETPAGHTLGLAGGDIPHAAHFQRGYTDPLDAQIWPIFEAVLLALRDEVEADGAEFAVVIAPEMYAIHPEWYFEEYPAFDGQRDLFDPDKLEKEVAALLDAHGIQSFSLTPALRDAAQDSDAPLYYRSNAHWTLAAHHAVTEALDGWFRDMGWAPAER